MCIWNKNKSAETTFLSIFERFWDVWSPFFFSGKHYRKSCIFSFSPTFFLFNDAITSPIKSVDTIWPLFWKVLFLSIFYRKFQFSTVFLSGLTNTTKFSENRDFHQKTQKLEETPENLKKLFIFSKIPFLRGKTKYFSIFLRFFSYFSFSQMDSIDNCDQLHSPNKRSNKL